MSKDIKKALEHCVEWNCVDCPNREELGSGETVCRGRLLPEVLNYVADLEAKLAESEKKREYLFSSNCEYVSEIEELKQQLVEKEKEIETLKKCGDTDHFYGLLEDKKREIDICRKYIEKHNQDKISFAVEQLEKVRHILLGHYSRTNYKCIKEVCRDIDKQINNQIKALKEGK